jgi:hypothetical protein
MSKVDEEEALPVEWMRRRGRVGMSIAVIGLFLLLLGARPALFGLDRSPVIGFVQIAVMLVGLAVICLGGFIGLISLWRGKHVSIAAGIGSRLVATGYLVSVFSGMADIFGIGSHPLPGVPYFGGLQARGVELGQVVIAIGFFLIIPFAHPDRSKNKNQAVK